MVSRAPRIIAGSARGRRLYVPQGVAVRPTGERAREALFNILEHGEPPLQGADVLDLFAGSGALGLEALSRGAARVTFVELDRAAREALRRNLGLVAEAERAAVLADDAARLRPARQPVDIVLMDPPYRSGRWAAALERLAGGGWLHEATRIVIEVAADEVVAAQGFLLDDERRYGAARLCFLRRATAAR